jgi:hypothetical protein
MRIHSQFHHSSSRSHWSPVNVALALLVTLLFLIFLLLFLVMTATPAQAQRALPSKAEQTTKLPEFAVTLPYAPRQAVPFMQPLPRPVAVS